MSKRTHYLQFDTPRVSRRPPGATPADLLRVLIDAAAEGKPLPAGWEVEQPYRNARNAAWKSVSVDRMIRDSANRGGDFVGLYLNRYLARQAERYGVSMKAPREATEEEIEAAERQLERISEREAGEFEELAKKQKRSTAAKKGAETKRRLKEEAARKKEEAVAKRKRTLAAKKRAAELAFKKRSEASKRGWEKRRRRERAEAAKAKRKQGKRKR